MSDQLKTYQTLIATMKEIALLNSASALLGWDERTQMPPRGAEHRGNTAALLARLSHEQFTSPRVGEQLSELEASDLVKDPESDAGANVREIRRVYDRQRKLPPELIEELSKTEVMSQQAWAEARKASNYDHFKPWLVKVLDLKRWEAKCVLGGESGDGQRLYDALLDPYEPYETTAGLRRVLEELRGPLVELIAKIAGSPRKAPLELLEREFPADAQAKLAREAAARVGFDFEAGRLDVSVHPFCSDIGPGDVRMTTRYDERYFGDAFFGVLHETGHGLYEQGLLAEHWGTPLGRAVSLGIHESQSRMWENFVGRSRSFWEFFLSKAKELFPRSLADVTPDAWYFAVNDVRPSLIRTEADEATYNLHILLRFELEQAMLSGEVGVDDLPQAWSAKMQQYLGITPPDDAKGCLQDIHWSGGAIGYFATYTLGNLYAAQFFEQAGKDLGDLDALFARGDFKPLLGWLREKIHRHGSRYPARALVQRVTGRELSARPLLEHLKRKARELYGA